MAKLYFSKPGILLLSLLALPLSGRADDTHTVLNSTESTYEHVMPLHLATLDEINLNTNNKYTSYLPYWATQKSDNSKLLSFPFSFDTEANCNEASSGSSALGWIVPEAFATTKTGAMLQIQGHYTDGKRNSKDYPSLMGKMSLISNNLSSEGEPNRQEDSKYMLFPGSMTLRYYLNKNSVDGTAGSKTMTLKSGYFRIRITSDILKKLQNAGLSIFGRSVYYDGISIVDPYAVFPGKDKTDKLIVLAPDDWWQNAIILNKKLFTNAVEGYFIHVYTSPDLSKNQSNSDVYKGYPTDANKQA